MRHDNFRGALWILASGLTFSLAMGLVKLLGPDYPAAAQNFVRQLVALLALAPFAAWQPRSAFTLRRPTMMITRCALTTVSMILSFNSFQHLGLAEANALTFTRGLFLVPLAAFLLSERIDRHKILAAVIGFGGVIIMLAPGSSESLIGWAAAQGLLASLLVSCSLISVKAMAKDHSDLALLTWSALLGAVFTAPFAFANWHTPTGNDLSLLIAMGILGVIAQACFTRAMVLGEAAVMVPVDYTRLLFMAAVGYAMFGELPLFNTYVGSAVIIGAALYITAQARKREVSAAPKT